MISKFSSALFILTLGFQVTAHSDEVLYQTSFEPPAFTQDLPLAGQERWEVDLGPEAVTISTNNPRTGTQSVRMNGPWLDPQASGFSMANARVRAADLPAGAPRVIVEVTASVRLEGPPAGMLGIADQSDMGASLLVYALTPDGRGDLLGGLEASSVGQILNISRLAEDSGKYSVPYTLGSWRTLTVRVDFQARRLTWLVDGIELGSGPFPDSITSDQLFSGTLLLIGPTEPRSTPDYNYDPANYTAWFDDYSLKSLSLEGPALLVEQPVGVRLTNSVSIAEFSNNLVGTPAARVFTLRNAGNAPITGLTATVEGSHASEFVLTASPSGTIPPGGSSPFTITFTPAAEGPRSATLRIASNDPDDNPFTLALTGRGRTPAEIVQQAYVKASNTGEGDFFGSSIAISGDTMVIGAGGEDSNARGINGNQNNNSAPDAGAAYVFIRDGTNWIQQAYLKASNAGANDGLGGGAASHHVAISGDTIVVGGPGESSNATGVNGDQGNNSANFSGAAYVFVREGTNWTQQAYLKASNTEAGDSFGQTVAISGNTLVVGASGEASNATGVNGDPTDNSVMAAGAAYVFVRAGTNWAQQAFLKASNTGANDYFGAYSLAISHDTIVVGAYGEDSNARGVNGNQTNNSAADSGAAYVFVRAGTNWTQQAYLKASNTAAGDGFGGMVAISDDTIAVGAFGKAQLSGAGYVFVRDGTNWTQQAYLRASNTGANDLFGYSVAILGDTIVVGATGEASNARGVNGNQKDNRSLGAGAAYVFLREGTNWTQQAYLKASNTEASNTEGWNPEEFGLAVAISGDTIVVGSPREDSNARGVNGDQNNNSAEQSGAAYVFTGAGPLTPDTAAPRVLSLARDPGGAINLTIEAAQGHSYTLQGTLDLVTWTDLITQSATTNRLDFTDNIISERRFYRIQQR